MKLTLLALGLVSLNLAAASPFSSTNEFEDLEARGSYCKYKEKQCCTYPDYKDKATIWGNGYRKPRYSDYPNTLYVKSGASIQKVIDKAHRGDTIIVAAGTYAEQLTINKDGIELVGKNAVLVPPAKPVKNTCSGLSGPMTEAGICVTGSGVKLTKFVKEHRKVTSVDQPVSDVSVTGFTVRGFSGINLVVIGARYTHVFKNDLTDGAQYGALTLGSVKTLVSDNKITSTTLGFIGICMDNFSGVRVTNNRISNYYIGVCVQTKDADIRYNDVTGCCIGAFVDPGVKGAKLRHNHIGPTNPICAAIKAGASGIIIDGGVKAEVVDNVIEGQALDNTAAGLVIVDDPCSGAAANQSLSCLALGHPAVASGNLALRNTFRNNDFDIFLNTTGKNNVVACNKCATPAELCKL